MRCTPEVPVRPHPQRGVPKRAAKPWVAKAGSGPGPAHLLTGTRKGTSAGGPERAG